MCTTKLPVNINVNSLNKDIFQYHVKNIIMVFPLVMYGHESGTIKKDELQRIDAFERWCWRRLLSIPWTARRSNQSILKEISPEYSIERTDAEAETPILWHVMLRTDSLEKTLMVGKIEGRRRRGDSGRDGGIASPT